MTRAHRKAGIPTPTANAVAQATPKSRDRCIMGNISSWPDWQVCDNNGLHKHETIKKIKSSTGGGEWQARSSCTKVIEFF